MNDTNEEEVFRKAKNIVLRLLRFRLRSEKELRDQLIAKKLPTPVVGHVIQYFKDCGLIDDQVFTQQWTSSRLKKPFGLRRIHRELKEKGIDPAIIEDVHQRILHDYNELAVATDLAKRRAKQYRKIDNETIKPRLYGFLVRRGFPSSIAIKAIHQL